MTEPTGSPPPDGPGQGSPARPTDPFGADAAPEGVGGGSPPPPGYGTAPPGYGPPPGYAASGPGYRPAPTAAASPAGLLVRVGARIIDFMLVGIVNGLITAILISAALGLDGGGFDGYGSGGSYVGNALSAVIGAAVSLAYFALMESRTGQTLGKMLLRLRTEGPHGGAPSLEVAVRRNFWVALGALAVVPVVGPFVGGIAGLVITIIIMVTISQSPTRQGWHDAFAGGTRVVRSG